MTETQTIEQFIEDHDLTMQVKAANENPNMPNGSFGMHHYRVTIENENTSVKLTTPYSMGSALTGPPELADVLDTLASDAATYENAFDRADFCYDLGYIDDADSMRDGMRAYDAIEKMVPKLKSLLGHAYNELLWDTERQ